MTTDHRSFFIFKTTILVLVLLSSVPDAAQTPTAPATQRRNPKDDQLYVWVPPGTFQMGCSSGDKECYEDERPTHIVQLSNGFWMGQTEVTVAAYQAFSKATGIAVSSGQQGSDYPVN